VSAFGNLWFGGPRLATSDRRANLSGGRPQTVRRTSGYQPFNGWNADVGLVKLREPPARGILPGSAQDEEARMGEESPKPASAPTGAVFLSYASQDAEAAQRIVSHASPYLGLLLTKHGQ